MAGEDRVRGHEQAEPDIGRRTAPVQQSVSGEIDQKLLKKKT